MSVAVDDFFGRCIVVELNISSLSFQHNDLCISSKMQMFVGCLVSTVS